MKKIDTIRNHFIDRLNEIAEEYNGLVELHWRCSFWQFKEKSRIDMLLYTKDLEYKMIENIFQTYCENKNLKDYLKSNLRITKT